jgi:hypothetical protein
MFRIMNTCLQPLSLALAAALALAPPASVRAGQEIQIVRPGPGGGGQIVLPPRDTRESKTGTARIRGRVAAGDTGAPLRRAQVRAFSPELREGRISSTDQQGRYEIKDLPAGRYTLTATKGGFVSLQYGQRRPYEAGKPLEIADGEAVERADFSLPRGSVITGRVTDEFGEPVAEAMVQVMRYRYFEGQRRLVPVARPDQTDDIGQYRVFGLPPGDYYVSATLRSFAAFAAESEDRSGYAPTYYPGTPNLAEAQRVTVALGQELPNVSFALMPTRTARISGTVFNSEGKPLANGFVTLGENMRGPGVVMFMGGGGSRVRPDGSFTISNVAPGEYLLEARTMGMGGGRGGRDEAEFAAVPVTVAGDDIAGLSIVTSSGATVLGTITFDQGAEPSFPPASVQLVAQSNDGGFRGAGGGTTVRDDWTFELRGLTGSRLIRTAALPPGWSLKGVFLGGMDITDTPTEFKASDDAAALQVVLANRTTEVSGGVTDDRGRTSREYVVVVFAEDGQRWSAPSRYIKTGRPDQDGRFKIRDLPPEHYLAVAVDYLEEGEHFDPAFLERIRSRATGLTIDAGEIKTLDLKLSPSR